MPSIAFSRRGFAFQFMAKTLNSLLLPKISAWAIILPLCRSVPHPARSTVQSASDSAPKGHERIAFRAASGFKDA
jgi:hypothetical protein